MGTINQGILGGVSGKVGNVVGGNWKGIDYLRIMPASVANPQTEAQMDQRSKFVTVLNFLQPLKDVVKVGFKDYAIKMTQFNSAMSYNLKNAITGEYPDYTIDFANALLSKGSLAPVSNGDVMPLAGGTIRFSWTDNSELSNANATDKAMVIIYAPELNEAVFLLDGAARGTETQNLSVPDYFSGTTAHAFMGFVSGDGKGVANSKYLGTINVV